MMDYFEVVPSRLLRGRAPEGDPASTVAWRGEALSKTVANH
jgi:hypothetical protein